MPLTEYIEQHSSPENEALQLITHRTHLRVINPRMLSGHIQGRVLSMISQMIHPHRILELGTFTGYSALCLAEGLTDDGTLLTIEHNDEMEDFIRENLALSPLGEKINLVITDAKEYLSTFNAAETTQFDLVFIDADKKEYCDYLDLVLPLMRKGGWILADNTLWDGHVVDEEIRKNDQQTKGIMEFNDMVKNDPRVEVVILPIRDGISVIRVK